MPISPAPSRFPVAATRSATAVLATLTLLAGVSACTRAPRTAAGSTSSSTATASGTSGLDSTSAAPGPTGSTTAPASASSTAALSTAPTPGPVSQPAPGPPACTSGALAVTVQRGSGAAGQQFATVRFSNKSASPCSLTGFPGVVLLQNGARLGQPATRTAKAVARVDLGPGAAATAQLTNVSTCNAVNSDSVQVIPPNLTTSVVLPLRFRGCNALSVDPVVKD